ncbi:hypothetical protein GDO81_002130 [Engystomops pustulosus]|uniref:Uncharacterized protein n=1 Tax=Engystomops pustulosus TaxID=76066 RepID=A0AAV7DHK5_ENGPU|nr:hypothetical protein GDO81_002130 [Engystomops pustulosus]
MLIFVGLKISLTLFSLSLRYLGYSRAGTFQFSISFFRGMRSSNNLQEHAQAWLLRCSTTSGHFHYCPDSITVGYVHDRNFPVLFYLLISVHNSFYPYGHIHIPDCLVASPLPYSCSISWLLCYIYTLVILTSTFLTTIVYWF